jgi:PadR family transcriptional regulator PadR
MASKPTDLLQGTLDLLILKTVSLQPLHGYAIAARINSTSNALLQVPQGSLYPALHRLENKGWLAAEWDETSTGREAKFYKLTRSGRQQLEHELADWKRLTDGIALILGTAGEPAQS